MVDQIGREYYLAHKPEIMSQFDVHVAGWRPGLIRRFGVVFAEDVLVEARQRYEALIPEIPYIGGDGNPMTRHLVRSTTSLILFKVMQAVGMTAAQVGEIVYEAVEAYVKRMPPHPSTDLSSEFVAEQRERERKSKERRFPGDWVQEHVEGDGLEFDYGTDFLECGTQKLYLAHAASEFLPFYCYLDFATHRTTGWGFARARTLSEGHDRCAFRWQRGGRTIRGWPPPFLPR